MPLAKTFRQSPGQLLDLEAGDLKNILGTSHATHILEPVVRKDGDTFSNESFASSTSSLVVEMWYDQQPHLPSKKDGRIMRNLRYHLFSVYRRLNIIVVIANVITISVLCMMGRLWKMDIQHFGTAAAANIVAAVLIRQELVINLIFGICGSCPQWMPLRFRRLVAKIYHLGGVHSGAGIAATVWFGFLNVPIIRAWKYDDFDDGKVETALVTVTISLDILLICIVVTSHPAFRSRFHDTWELLHRFGGWAAVALFWAHLMLLSNTEHHISHKPMTEVLIKSPIFWCLFVMTISLVLPWLRLRKVLVRAEKLSDHAIRLHFSYMNVSLCAAPRLSDSPLKEWHAFAGIPEGNGNGFSILVSAAGDWTRKLIKNPPKQLWTRGVPAKGVMHIAPIFKRMVIVATGSGIGPVLALLYARNVKVRIIWSTRDPVQTYTFSVLNQVKLADPDAIILNSSQNPGRYPDLVLEAYKLYCSSRAEAVFVISNSKVTRTIVYGLESRGVPTFGPVFDS